MNVLLLRMGLLLGFSAVFLQIAVFLQPLLPKQYQIAPVCETISQALIQSDYYQIKSVQYLSHLQHGHAEHRSHEMLTQERTVQTQIVSVHTVSEQQTHQATMAGHDHHDPGHQCQYCTVYGNLVLPPTLEIKEVLDKVQVRLLAFQQAFRHVWFVLQRLFLLPQGRAPPLFA